MPTLPEMTSAALARLERTLDEENKALSSFDSRNLSEFSRVKTQCLLELERAIGSVQGGSSELTARLHALREKLELNRWLLLLHLEAAKEITSVIMSAIRDAESDGTYSRSSSLMKVFE